ncbi:type III-B CRISPR module RAMP protein Cmr4 [Spirulina subsalsa FACHB-351]|uniref:Type III-B CRISPR module RAMP protein Cmr4 n=1 Tax=Spirulina subsalsa FACHB-351 TaxID=234711 RepID=A0ABT3L0Y6_9CYAN|nr:type III-B CRISPR module RAMP protein Cmr4 [Spirulina subsalsa]MCW6034764.1 type III-B CRISPR module RAMP protein Cmr4 [Spirulina subsalsa FACHB-351]
MATYKRQRYLFMTLDPVHIGTGGYRLGRVDNSIVREPGTKIPKIPGTSLHGAARSYAAQLYETPEAAGQSHNNVTGDIAENPVCYTFGYIKGQDICSGVVNIFDAHILLFPVHSMVGPVWVSTLERLEESGFTVTSPTTSPTQCQTEQVLLNWKRSDPLNLGWLMLNVAETKAEIEAPPQWQNETRYKAISKKIVIVKDALFSQIVNSNLEVRTSVAIDPETGAADEGKLFTYEAIPRATFLTAEVVLDDYRQAFPNPKPDKTGKNNPLPGEPWNCPLCVVKAGFKMIEWLGVGGMGTRGFGRMAMIGDSVTVGIDELLPKQQASNAGGEA